MFGNRKRKQKQVECRRCGENEIKHILDTNEYGKYRTIFVCGHEDYFSQEELDGNPSV